MTMAERLLKYPQGQGEGYKRMAVLGEMRCQQITSHLSRLRLYNHAPDPFNSPLFRVR